MPFLPPNQQCQSTKGTNHSQNSIKYSRALFCRHLLNKKTTKWKLQKTITFTHSNSASYTCHAINTKQCLKFTKNSGTNNNCRLQSNECTEYAVKLHILGIEHILCIAGECNRIKVNKTWYNCTYSCILPNMGVTNIKKAKPLPWWWIKKRWGQYVSHGAKITK